MSSFTEFLRSKRLEEQAEGPVLAKRKAEWLRSLDELFEQIAFWLQEPMAQNLVTLEKETIELNEYRLGSYTAPRLVLQIGHDTVYVEPVGTYVIGAKGRVDMKTRGASSKPIWTEDGWGVLEPERTIARGLDEATFTKALQNLLS